MTQNTIRFEMRVHWRYPKLADRYPDQGQNQYERTNRVVLNYEDKDLESNQPRGQGAMLGMKNGFEAVKGAVQVRSC